MGGGEGRSNVGSLVQGEEESTVEMGVNIDGVGFWRSLVFY